MTAFWKPDIAELKRLRENADKSIRDLARESGVSAKTIGLIERGLRDAVESDTLKALANPLGVAWKKLVYEDPSKRAAKYLAEMLPPRSSLDVFAFAEREKPAPRLETPHGPLRCFGAGELVDSYTSPRTHEGDRFYVTGQVAYQRGMNPRDESVLSAEPLCGGRFEIARLVDPELPPLTLILFARKRAHTKALQEHWRKPEPICAIVRVFVAAPIQGEADKIEVTDLQNGGHIVRSRPLGPPKWAGFEFITAKPSGESGAGRPKLHPWCLLVEEIASAGNENA
jgi:transcriptional regulator with XRE-family HTH domain